MERNLNLKAEIVRSGQSQQELAKAVGIPATTLSLIISGRMVAYDREKVAIAKALSKPIGSLFD